MADGGAVTQSRWVTRTLWLIVAGLAAVILTVRSHGLVNKAELGSSGQRPNAVISFSLPAIDHADAHSIDAISWAGHPPVSIHDSRPPRLPGGLPITISGWAFDVRSNHIFSAIGAKVDKRPEVFSAAMGLERPDVARALGRPAAHNSGFTLDIDSSRLTLGGHTIAIRAIANDRRHAVALGPPIAFDVIRPASAAQTTDSIDAVNGIVINADSTHTTPLVLQRSYSRLTLSGWGFITAQKRLATGGSILVDGTPTTTATFGIMRGDVANAYHDVRLARSGFRATLSTDSLSTGPHEIRFQMSTSEGESVESGAYIRVNVE